MGLLETLTERASSTGHALLYQHQGVSVHCGKEKKPPEKEDEPVEVQRGKEREKEKPREVCE